MSATINFKFSFNKELNKDQSNFIKEDITSFLLINQRPSEDNISEFCRNRDFHFSIKDTNILVYTV